jgi:hypothetical protein
MLFLIAATTICSFLCCIVIVMEKIYDMFTKK